MGKELVYNLFELGRGEIAGCRAVILPEGRNGGDGQPKVRSKESGALQGFLLSATGDRRDLRDPGLLAEGADACVPAPAQTTATAVQG